MKYLLRYILQGLAVAIVARLYPKVNLNINEIIYIAAISSTTFCILDLFAPNVYQNVLNGIGFNIGKNIVEGLEEDKEIEKQEEIMDQKKLVKDEKKAIEDEEYQEAELKNDEIAQVIPKMDKKLEERKQQIDNEINKKGDSDIIPIVESVEKKSKKTGKEYIEAKKEEAEKKQINCEDLGQIVDPKTGNCVAVVKKTGEMTKVKETKADENLPKVYIVKCKNGPASCIWKETTKDKVHDTYGYSFIPPTEWSIPQKRTPVCLPQEKCTPCPTYTSTDSIDLLQVRNLEKNVPKFELKQKN